MTRSIMVLICILLIPPVFADQVILQPAASASEDSYIDQANPQSNYGQQETMLVSLAAGGETMILLRFDELDDYQGVSVNALTLEFYVESISELIYTRVYRVGEGWSEDSVTWNNRPSLVPGTDIVSIIPDFGCWDDVDITDYGIEWLENGAENNGLYMIFDADEYDSCVISSAENADPSHAPRLILDYTPLAVETASWGAIKAME